MLCTTTTVNLSSTGSAAFNAGVEFASDAINGIGTDSFIRTSVSSVVIGAALSFSRPLRRRIQS